MQNKILLVFEGKKTESNYFQFFKDFLEDKTEEIKQTILVETCFCGPIYSLYNLIKTKYDDSEDLFLILKERNEHLQNYSSDSFGEIYLFFDYDSHSTQFSKEKIEQMLSHFDNETENGKLFISYPMIESLKHIKDIKNKADFMLCKFNCKNGKKYKSKVTEDCDKIIHKYLSLRENTKDKDNVVCKTIIDFHCCKANFITNKDTNFPSSLICQKKLFSKQYEESNDNKGELYVLNAFPLMLLDYLGSDKLKKKINTSFNN